MKWQTIYFVILTGLTFCQATCAEIVTDGSLGIVPVTLPLKESKYEITRDLGKSQGNNLFYSFERFNLGAGETATFTDKLAQNLIARVTGGAPSNINGTLQAFTNLYLINPYGWVIGNNATIDVTGSLYIGGDHITFSDKQSFGMSSEKPLLRIPASPEEFGFLGDITIGKGTKIEAKELSLIGKNIGLTGGTTVKIRSGKDYNDGLQVNIIAEQQLKLQESTVKIVGENGNNYTMNIKAYNSVELNNSRILVPSSDNSKPSEIHVHTDKLIIMNPDSSIDARNETDSNPGGNIFIKAGTVNISGAYAGINTSTSKSGNAGDIVLNAHTLTITNNATLQAMALKDSSGNAGNIHIEVDNLSISGKGDIDTSSKGAGKAGNVTILVSGTLSMTALPGQDAEAGSVIKSGFLGGLYSVAVKTGGTGGEINITANNIQMIDGATISSGSVAGNAGNAQINVKEIFNMVNAAIKANAPQAQGGFVLVNAPTGFVILNKSEIDAAKVDIVAEHFILSADSRLNAKEIKAPTPINLASKIPLSADFAKDISHLFDCDRPTAKVSLRATSNSPENIKTPTFDLLGNSAAPNLSNIAPETYDKYWKQGQEQKAKGENEAAIESYKQAVYLLQWMPQDFLEKNHDTVQQILSALIELLLEKAMKQPNDIKLLQDIIDYKELSQTSRYLEYFQNDRCIEKQKQKEELRADTAIIYPFILSNRLDILVKFSNNRIKYFTTDVSKPELEGTIKELNSYLEPPSENTSGLPPPSAQKLYNWIIRPLLSSPEFDKVDTLVFVPEGQLNTIPFSVLHSGQQFLIENYAVAVTPALKLTIQPGKLQSTKKPLLLLAVLTKSPDEKKYESISFNFVKSKLIEPLQQKQTVEINFLRDTQFTFSELERLLMSHPYDFFQIFSQANFGETIKETFIVSADPDKQYIDMEKLNKLLKNQQQSIRLLILTACKTAKGNEKAAFGLSGTAFKAGVPSVLGTLWRILDNSVPKLLPPEFYSEISQKSKAKALQRVQKDLIEKDISLSVWSAFVLIGDWL